MMDSRTLLAEAAEKAHEEGRARHVAVAWGDPPDWGGKGPRCSTPRPWRVQRLGLEAAAAATLYEAMLQEAIRQQ